MSRCDVQDLEEGAIEQTFLLVEPTIQETKNGDPYLRATLQDSTGEIPMVQFDTAEAPEQGLYYIEGFVERYKGELQVKPHILEPTEGDLDEFVPSSDLELDFLRAEIETVIENLGGEVGDIVRSIFDEETLGRFVLSPAASSNHHAYRGGLAEHTVSMYHLADRVIDFYRDLLGVEIDNALVLGGVLLHDLGKIVELEPDGPTHVYGLDGELVGHIAECVTMIHDAAAATLASDRTRRRLIHMVLSHHGKKEHGSPVEPKILEAEILHQIDAMDSRVAMFREATDGLEEGEMTSARVFPLGRRLAR